jgi:hypothetical protein
LLARTLDCLLGGELGRVLELLDDVAICPQRQLGAVAKLAGDVDDVAALMEKQRRE